MRRYLKLGIFFQLLSAFVFILFVFGLLELLYGNNTILVPISLFLLWYPIHLVSKYLSNTFYNSDSLEIKIDFVKMNFKHWKDIYYINPDVWILGDVQYNYWNGGTEFVIRYASPLSDNKKYPAVYFNLIDYYKFRIWYRTIHQKEKNQKQLNQESIREKQVLKYILENTQEEINQQMALIKSTTDKYRKEFT